MGYSARNMSVQRRSDLAQPPPDPRAPEPVAGPAARRVRFAGLRQRLPFYALGIAAALAMLAWIDGGEEPLHPIAQAIALEPSVAEPQ